MRLFVFDIDGTLINNHKIELKENLKNRLNEILKRGDVIAIASGRPYAGIIQIINQLDEGKKFLLCANGNLITDVDGKFRISNVPSSANTLIISYIGLEEQKVSIKPNLRVVMKSSSEVLDEVIVVAYGNRLINIFGRIGGVDQQFGTQQKASVVAFFPVHHLFVHLFATELAAVGRSTGESGRSQEAAADQRVRNLEEPVSA